MQRMRSWAAIAMTALVLLGTRAHAAGGTVAVMPAHVFKGAQGNGARVTDALRSDLEKHGFTLLPAVNVEDALRRQKTDLAHPAAIAELAALRDAMGVDYLVYPRV